MIQDFMTEKEEAKHSYSDEEINELAEWMGDLTIKQLFFLKESYEAHKQINAEALGFEYVQ